MPAARQSLQGLHHIRRTEQGKAPVQSLLRERHLARLCSTQRGVQVGSHQHLVQPVVRCQTDVQLTVLRQCQLQRPFAQSHEGDTQPVGTFRKGEAEETVLVRQGTASGGLVPHGGIDDGLPVVLTDVAAERVSLQRSQHDVLTFRHPLQSGAP